jgi:glucose/arabinose dehydrogenase
VAAVSSVAGFLASCAAADAALQLEPVLSGLDSPDFVTSAGDGSGRLFVVEQVGVIEVLAPGAGAPTVFLDLGSKVLVGGERGLLGLAFHPGFASNRRFFVDYTRQPDGATVIAEYQASAGDPDVADSAETVLLVIPQPFANHNGGMVAFGPDGFLYVGMGDGGSGNDPGNRAQNLGQLLGKILRLDVDTPAGALPYSAPADNPFVATPGARSEIYAYGLRNPFRFSFDRATGTLYAGDVGQNAVEEIDVITSGGNYGWRIWEGNRCTGNDPTLCATAGFVFPIAEYTHAGGRCAVIGGYAYRGALATLPAGSYVYGDLCTGEIFLLQNGRARVVLATALAISSFGEDGAGEIYVVGIGGTVHRLVPGPPCAFTLTPTGLAVSARGTRSAKVSVRTAAGCHWTATSNVSWLSVIRGASGNGNGSVSITVGANRGRNPRTGRLTIGDQVFTVTQSGAGTGSPGPRPHRSGF